MISIHSAEHDSLKEKAKATLAHNDFGGYTVPTHGLYPFQWNWDSAITALGWFTYDEERAWEEVELLLSGQWENGMIPHIIFHKESNTYFPGPDVWGSHREVKSTSISQPPVLATIARILYEKSSNREKAEAKLRSYLTQFLDYHLWWYQERDPDETGLVVSYHPWESGMDNSPAWDESLAAVPCVEWEYQRCDLGHIDSSERPHKKEYDRYLYLVEFFKKQNFDSQAIYQATPYKVNDLGIIAILHRATKDLIHLCKSMNLKHTKISLLEQRLTLTQNAIGQLWCDESNLFYSRDMLTGNLCKVEISAGLLPVFAGLVTPQQAEKLKAKTSNWLASSAYGVASTHPSYSGYEPQRYWRGPVWLHINWMIALGFIEYGYEEIALTLKQQSLELVERSGYYEYFNADTGEGCGGDDFSWTAAIALYWLLD